SRAELKTVGLIQALGLATANAGHTAIRIGDAAPGLEQIALVLRGKHQIPVDRRAQPLRIGIGIEAVVESGGEEPDFAAGALRWMLTSPYWCRQCICFESASGQVMSTFVEIDPSEYDKDAFAGFDASTSDFRIGNARALMWLSQLAYEAHRKDTVEEVALKK